MWRVSIFRRCFRLDARATGRGGASGPDGLGAALTPQLSRCRVGNAAIVSGTASPLRDAHGNTHLYRDRSPAASAAGVLLSAAQPRGTAGGLARSGGTGARGVHVAVPFHPPLSRVRSGDSASDRAPAEIAGGAPKAGAAAHQRDRNGPRVRLFQPTDLCPRLPPDVRRAADRVARAAGEQAQRRVCHAAKAHVPRIARARTGRVAVGQLRRVGCAPRPWRHAGKVAQGIRSAGCTAGLPLRLHAAIGGGDRSADNRSARWRSSLPGRAS